MKVKEYMAYGAGLAFWIVIGWFFLEEIVIALGYTYTLVMLIYYFSWPVVLIIGVVVWIRHLKNENKELKEKIDELEDENFLRGKENE